MNMEFINLYLRGRVIPVLRIKENGRIRLFTLREIDEEGLEVSLSRVLTVSEAIDPHVTPEKVG